MRSDMHADDSHNNKPGFFSKIFGHGDDAAQQATAQTPAPEQPGTIVEPTSPDAPDMTPAVPSEAPASTDTAVVTPDLQSGTMSDVHAAPGGSPEALDLSASQVDQPIDSSATEVPTTPAPEEASADTFQLPDIKTPEATADPIVPVTVPSEIQPDAAHEEVLFDSSQPTQSTEEAPQDDSNEVAAAVEGTEVHEAPSTEATPDVEPPAPPVEEGEAWRESQTSEQEETAPEAPQAQLNGAQDQVDTILAAHPDLTTDSAEANEGASSPEVTPTPEAEEHTDPVEPVMPVSPLEKSSSEGAASEPAPSDSTAAETGQSSEQAAAIVRLTNHIDDLESGLQKIRDELAALKK